MTYDFPYHIKGDTFKGTEFEILSNALPVNLTGYRIRMHMRSIATSTTILHAFDTDDGTIVINDAAGGKFTLQPVVIDLPARTYVYDIEFTKAGVVKTWIRGTWPIINDVTR